MITEKIIKFIDENVIYLITNIIGNFKNQKRNLSFVDLEKISKVLVIRPGGIGDAILLIPLIKTLCLKGKKIEVLCMRRNKPIFDLLLSEKLITKIYLFENIGDIIELTSNSEYDVIFDTEQWFYTSSLFAFIIRHKILIGFDTNKRRKIYDYFVHYRQEDYESQSFLNLLQPFSISLNYTDVGFNLNLNHKNHTELSDKKYIVIFNGGSSANRKILKADMKLLIHQLTENYEQIVMIGGKTELLDETFYLSLSSKVLSYISKTSIKQTLSIINNAEAFISTDSGPLHFSLLTEQKKVIAIFGPGLDDKWCEKNRMKVLKKGLICQPCNYGRFSQTPDCPYDYLCLKNIDINLLLKYTNEGILR
jgi:ADP-heptose:LPS heptosyltransferase